MCLCFSISDGKIDDCPCYAGLDEQLFYNAKYEMIPDSFTGTKAENKTNQTKSDYFNNFPTFVVSNFALKLIKTNNSINFQVHSLLNAPEFLTHPN